MGLIDHSGLVLRFTKANMGAAAILSDIIKFENTAHPMLDTCSKMRGLKPDCFIRWANRVSDSVYSPDDKLSLLIDGTLKCFRQRLTLKPECRDELLALCDQVDQFLKRYRNPSCK